MWAIYPTVTVEVDGGLTSAIEAWGAMTLGTLPTAIRPPMNLIFPLYGSSGSYGMCVAINSNGTVQIANRNNSQAPGDGREIFTACTYCCAT